MTAHDERLRFGTVGSPQTTPGSGTQAGIAHAAELGLEHLEIAWTRSVRIKDESCASIRADRDAYNLTLSVHAPYYINLNSQTAKKMKASDERLLTAARKGYLSGAADIVFHPGSYHGQPPAEVYPRIKAQLEDIVGRLRDDDIAVTLRPETMGKAANFGNLEEVLRLSAEIDGVMPCIDWAHLHARRGDGSFNSYAEFTDALDMIRDALGDEALQSQMHFHLSGIAYTAKGEKEHLPLNEADFAYRELLQAFVEYGVGGTVGVEAPQPFHTADALTLQATYRRLLEQAAD